MHVGHDTIKPRGLGFGELVKRRTLSAARRANIKSDYLC